MRNIKVYLKYPWRFPDSPYYKYLVDGPPKGIKYLNVANQKGVIISRRKHKLSNVLKRGIRKSVGVIRAPIPNAHPVRTREEMDLIHCAHCLCLDKKRPWVADIECLKFMWLSGKPDKMGRKLISKILMRDNCRKIMPWTKDVEEDIKKTFPEAAHKVEYVYPAVPTPKLPPRKKGPIRILFAARYFKIKGGLIVLDVMERLREKYDIEGIVVSEVPGELKKKYPKLKIYDIMPTKDLMKIMGKSDIFLYPTFIDTFGFALLEAMSYGLPIITTNTDRTPSRREIVDEGKTGYILDVKGKVDYEGMGPKEGGIANWLFERCSGLIEDKKLLKSMSKESRKQMLEKFSIPTRNKKLEKIYREALDGKSE